MKCILLCDDSKPESVVDLCRRHDLGIEVQAFYHPDALSNAQLVKATAELTADLPVVAMHGPFGDLNPGSFDPLVRDTARRRIQEGFEVARPLGARHIVYHNGRVPGAGPEVPWIARSVTFWTTYMKQVPSDVHVYLENMLEEGPNVLSNIVDGVNCANLHANLDIGHAHCHSHVPVVEWIVSLGARIAYVHMHDNNGRQDEHLGLGRGTMPMQEVCHALEEHAAHAIWAIEAEEPGILQSLEWLDKHAMLC